MPGEEEEMVKETEEEDEEDGLEYETNAPQGIPIRLLQALGVVLYLLQLPVVHLLQGILILKTMWPFVLRNWRLVSRHS